VLQCPGAAGSWCCRVFVEQSCVFRFWADGPCRPVSVLQMLDRNALRSCMGRGWVEGPCRLDSPGPDCPCPDCPGPNCPGPDCPGPDCPGPYKSPAVLYGWIRALPFSMGSRWLASDRALDHRKESRSRSHYKTHTKIATSSKIHRKGSQNTGKTTRSSKTYFFVALL